MKFFDKFNVSNESIDFQSSTFGKELEMIFGAIRNKYKKHTDIFDCPEKKILEKIIFKHTGLSIYIEFNTDILAATSIPQITKNHILINENRRTYFMEKDALTLLRITKQDKKIGYVDINKARVSGLFSELTNIILISGSYFLTSKLSIQEYTSIILHEIGHIFVTFEYINRTNTTNQVLAAVCRAVVQKENIKTRETVFKEASEILDITDHSLMSVVNTTNLTVLTTVILKASVDNVVSELGLKEYNDTSFEFLADQFSVRHGYGRHLVIGLDKLYAGDPQRSLISFFMQFIFESATVFFTTQKLIVIFIGLTSATIVTFPFILYNLAMLTLSFSAYIIFKGSKHKDYTYDILKTRYLRIKEQNIQRLKDKSIDPEESKNIIESIKIMDNIITATYEYRGPLDIINDFIFPADKKVRQSVLLQRQIETLAMNDFFVKSAELKNI